MALTTPGHGKATQKSTAQPASASGATNPVPARATSEASSAPSSSLNPGAWTPAEGEVGVRVRMYRVGFGDFFLVSCLDAGGKQKVVRRFRGAA